MMFIPLIFLSGISGALFYDQAIAIVIGQGVSLLVGITLLPTIYYLLYKNGREGVLTRFVKKISLKDLEDRYEGGMNFFFRFRKTMIVSFLAIILIMVWLFFTMEKGKYPGDYFRFYNVYESTGYLFFEFRYRFEGTPYAYFYLCIFDKKTRDIVVCQDDKTFYPALVDDINGFMPISPLQVNNKNEMTAVLQAKDIKKWRDVNPDKATSLKGKLPWLNTIDEFDNPVIVIGKCKD